MGSRSLHPCAVGRDIRKPILRAEVDQSIQSRPRYAPALNLALPKKLDFVQPPQDPIKSAHKVSESQGYLDPSRKPTTATDSSK